jgi:eukaryotic-like serine/threonine-protein kinase
MVVDAGYPGYDVAGYGNGPYDSGYGGDQGGHRAGGAHRGDDDQEPFLQRWLFSRRVVYLIAALAVLIGLAGGGWWLTTGRYTTVPAVSKLTSKAAGQALRQAGFQVRTGTPVIDDNVPKGDVIAVSPSARALPGATITLTISQGPRMRTVPPIPATDSVAQAEAALRAAGLTVAAATQPVGVPSNPVIGQLAGTNPAAGTSTPENKPVTVEVVAGLSLPNLVNQNITAVQQWAGQNQVTIQATQVTNNAAQGTIVTQSPIAGSVVTPGQTVSVSVSNGPPQVPIPNVQGQNCQQAQQTLQQAGFNVQVQQGFFHKNMATGTSPSGQAPGGSAVTLSCGSNNPF